MIAADHGFDPEESLLVGDTEGDVLAARRVGISALGVRNGLREPRVLAAAGPCVLIDTIEGLIGWLGEAGRTSGRETTMGGRTCARW
jgi:phosphoglycolate phosphatase-like HAD superfamily hydrolase